ncbi:MULTISPECIES: tripartite tricarboxylate transporter substrate binding protein [unclassified Beijerinckia]|uniref:Bug family tripartite tricarboxylate transporter substrate binding protein n=1 Tax=unclassified Beijerinckia TaxID=2638183 RepID=UPI00089B70F3|nr:MULTISPECIES: tripartite tricarboxylate transporter substrate binding protein [unclassified Beijerinckia]MDH7796545.1 tripartite-type tricarboxylate transporter receptor subunit TctC [Beijerinckia sp. GAS462]SEC49621.1 Tripartite-type tricarboxylate transporter, receptor component TctC [Beijerinckia sp. 28-YEA-48]
MQFRLTGTLQVLGMMAAMAGAAVAQTFPDRPIRMIVPYVAGGATDASARLFAAKLQEQMKVAVIIENRAGAGGNVGSDAVAKAAPDGYTILFNINGQAISPSIYKSLPFDADKDFIRVTQLVATSTVIVVHPKVPAKNLQELVALAKAKPGVLNYGSTGIGNSLHLTMELLKKETGTDIQMVPFRGDAPLFQSLLTGDIEIALVPTSATKPHIESGAVRAIGITTAQRTPSMPDVPTIAEQGLPNFIVAGWMGLFLPAKTPRAIVDRYWREAKTTLEAPDMKERLATMELQPVGNTPEEFDKVYFDDRARFARVIKEANIPQQD